MEMQADDKVSLRIEERGGGSFPLLFVFILWSVYSSQKNTCEIFKIILEGCE